MHTAPPFAPPTDDRATPTLLVAGLGIFMVFLDTQILFVAFGGAAGSAVCMSVEIIN